jgi:hypothetical protein
LRRSCCSPDAAECGPAAVTAAAVPAHVTPLARERSNGSKAQGSVGGDDDVAEEASGGAGGQLHWNPLYDPNAMACSPIPGYMADR